MERRPLWNPSAALRLHRDLTLDLLDTDIIVVQDGDELAGEADDYDAFVGRRAAALGVGFDAGGVRTAGPEAAESAERLVKLHKEVLAKRWMNLYSIKTQLFAWS